MRETKQLDLDGWTLRVRDPGAHPETPVLLMLHGWKGNEEVMWIFGDNLPGNALMIAPRAIFPAPGSGYSWVQQRSDSLSPVEKFIPAIESLDALVLRLKGRFPANWDQVNLIGFSQGAALSYAWAFANPGKVDTVAGLAGFVPAGAERWKPPPPFYNRHFFVAHGSRDDVVPVERMRSDIRILENAGADVTYCEGETGHKLNAQCFRALKNFYEAGSL